MTRGAICALGRKSLEAGMLLLGLLFRSGTGIGSNHPSQAPDLVRPKRSCNCILVLPTTLELGDELLIRRFVGDLKAHFVQVVVLSNPWLHPLLERSFPGVVCRDSSEISANAELPTWQPKSIWPIELDSINNSCRAASAH